MHCINNTAIFPIAVSTKPRKPGHQTWLSWFCTYCNWKMEILATFSHFQDEKEVNSRYKGWYYTHLVYYYNNFYFETDGSRIRPLPSTTVNLCNCTNQYICYFNNSVWSMILVWVSWRSSKTEQVKSLCCLKCGSYANE